MHQEEAPSGPQLLLDFPADYPDKQVADILADFALPEASISIHKTDNGPYMAFEWAIPTIIGAYLLKPYIEALSQEAAKDHYPKIVAGLKALATQCRTMRPVLIAASQSTHKLSNHYHQSGAFSIVVQTQSGQQVKMLFDENLSQADWEDAIEVFLDLAVISQQCYPNDPLTATAANLGTKPSQALYAVYNREAKRWEFQNDRTMLAIQQKGTV